MRRGAGGIPTVAEGTAVRRLVGGRSHWGRRALARTVIFGTVKLNVTTGISSALQLYGQRVAAFYGVG